ncbi:hypothetical protein [Pelagibius sp. Alg239-R121]|uniref:hypothetical protein n=1 Tax=Pelagibius sp. Alg239-R121 TaxID=2993448 RepID=UPI0024A6CA7D|nr:hypothetical protein [Pelagibius sp. Alg239-R121]
MAKHTKYRPTGYTPGADNKVTASPTNRRARMESTQASAFGTIIADLEQEVAAQPKTDVAEKTDSRPTTSSNVKNVAPITLARHRRNRPSSQSVEEAQLALFEAEREGRFSASPLSPSQEFPTILTRIPIFVPGKRTTQRSLMDTENAIPFSTSWARGKKYGPPLTVYDEDTLIALTLLRQNQLIGAPAQLPIPIADIHSRVGATDVAVHVVHCTLADIQELCECSQGGRNNQLRIESVKRLSNTKIQIERNIDRNRGVKGTSLSLIEVAWQTYEEDAVFLAQFPPIMAKWLENEYTFIDLQVRRQLSDTGKAIHRFLSSQGPKYEIDARKLMHTIGYMDEYKSFMRKLRATMEKLGEAGWLSDYEIVGTGRRVPQKLCIQRSSSHKRIDGKDVA